MISADISLDVVEKLINSVRKVKTSDQDIATKVLETLAKEIEIILQPRERNIFEENDQTSKILIFIGVNGSGKTTTIGKFSKHFSEAGKSVVLAAGDTFRAAAIEQLQIWGERTNSPVITREAGADAAGLAFDALEQAQAKNADLLLIDTAGRLHNKADLMAELEKIVRVLKKRDESAPHDCVLVLDATTGQNAISQVETFEKVAPVTGLVVTKLDGSAKGGVLVALAEKFKLPVHAIGVGEGGIDEGGDEGIVGADFTAP